MFHQTCDYVGVVILHNTYVHAYFRQLFEFVWQNLACRHERVFYTHLVLP